MLTSIRDLGYLEEPYFIKENAMNENEIVEISLLLSKAHLRLLEDLADSKHCSLGEAVRLLLKQSSKLR
ncbi:MAG: hypothetical protein EBT92_05060 [Planctomycetes bacterium]|nr:hypothetical protein [Planctomycetota bacterium]NBY02652.1 hypothetical protein [Planctomycetota bacterium]